jgi:hypothetical protein
MPAWDQTQGVSQIDDKTIESLKACPRQMIARFGKGAIADNTLQIAITAQAGKEAVEGDLYSRRTHRHKSGDELGQWKLAFTGKGLGSQDVSHVGDKLAGENALRELGEKFG